MILSVFILVTVYILTRKVNTWKIRRAYSLIIKDLERLGAINCSSTAGLPYAKKSMFRIGMRDYRSKCLEYLIIHEIIGKTDNRNYY